MTDEVVVLPGTTLPVAVARVLEAARISESTATGHQRRGAFRSTRHLLAGARTLGYPLAELAAVMNVRTDTIRGRAMTDGLVSVMYFCALGQIEHSKVHSWQRAGLLGPPRLDDAGQPGYLASDLLRLLIEASE